MQPAIVLQRHRKWLQKHFEQFFVLGFERLRRRGNGYEDPRSTVLYSQRAGQHVAGSPLGHKSRQAFSQRRYFLVHDFAAQAPLQQSVDLIGRAFAAQSALGRLWSQADAATVSTVPRSKSITRSAN